MDEGITTDEKNQIVNGDMW